MIWVWLLEVALWPLEMIMSLLPTVPTELHQVQAIVTGMIIANYVIDVPVVLAAGLPLMAFGTLAVSGWLIARVMGFIKNFS